MPTPFLEELKKVTELRKTEEAAFRQQLDPQRRVAEQLGTFRPLQTLLTPASFLAEAGATLFGAEETAARIRGLARAREQAAEESRAQLPETGKIVETLETAGGSLLTSAALGLPGRFVAPASQIAPTISMIAAAGPTVGAEQFLTSRLAGATEEEAFREAGITGLVESGITAAFTLVGLGGIEKSLQPTVQRLGRQALTDTLKRLPADVVKNLGAEVVEEASIAALGKIGRRLVGVTEAEFSSPQFQQELSEELQETVKQTLFQAGAVRVGRILPERRLARQQAERQQLAQEQERADIALALSPLHPAIQANAERVREIEQRQREAARRGEVRRETLLQLAADAAVAQAETQQLAQERQRRQLVQQERLERLQNPEIEVAREGFNEIAAVLEPFMFESQNAALVDAFDAVRTPEDIAAANQLLRETIRAIPDARDRAEAQSRVAQARAVGEGRGQIIVERLRQDAEKHELEDMAAQIAVLDAQEEAQLAAAREEITDGTEAQIQAPSAVPAVEGQPAQQPAALAPQGGIALRPGARPQEALDVLPEGFTEEDARIALDEIEQEVRRQVPAGSKIERRRAGLFVESPAGVRSAVALLSPTEALQRAASQAAAPNVYASMRANPPRNAQGRTITEAQWIAMSAKKRLAILQERGGIGGWMLLNPRGGAFPVDADALIALTEADAFAEEYHHQIFASQLTAEELRQAGEFLGVSDTSERALRDNADFHESLFREYKGWLDAQERQAADPRPTFLQRLFGRIRDFFRSARAAQQVAPAHPLSATFEATRRGEVAARPLQREGAQVAAEPLQARAQAAEKAEVARRKVGAQRTAMEQRERAQAVREQRLETQEELTPAQMELQRERLARQQLAEEEAQRRLEEQPRIREARQRGQEQRERAQDVREIGLQQREAEAPARAALSAQQLALAQRRTALIEQRLGRQEQQELQLIERAAGRARVALVNERQRGTARGLASERVQAANRIVQIQSDIEQHFDLALQREEDGDTEGAAEVFNEIRRLRRRAQTIRAQMASASELMREGRAEVSEAEAVQRAREAEAAQELFSVREGDPNNRSVPGLTREAREQLEALHATVEQQRRAAEERERQAEDLILSEGEQNLINRLESEFDTDAPNFNRRDQQAIHLLIARSSLIVADPRLNKTAKAAASLRLARLGALNHRMGTEAGGILSDRQDKIFTSQMREAALHELMSTPGEKVMRRARELKAEGRLAEMNRLLVKEGQRQRNLILAGLKKRGIDVTQFRHLEQAEFFHVQNAIQALKTPKARLWGRYLNLVGYSWILGPLSVGRAVGGNTLFASTVGLERLTEGVVNSTMQALTEKGISGAVTVDQARAAVVAGSRHIGAALHNAMQASMYNRSATLERLGRASDLITKQGEYADPIAGIVSSPNRQAAVRLLTTPQLAGLTAVDEFSRSIVAQFMLTAMAMNVATQRGVSVQGMDAFVDQIMASPTEFLTEEQIDTIVDTSDMIALNSELTPDPKSPFLVERQLDARFLALAQAGEKIRGWETGLGVRPVQLLVNFYRTFVNGFRFSVRYEPHIGGILAALETYDAVAQGREAKATAPQARLRAVRQVLRMSMGMGLIALLEGWWEDEEERKVIFGSGPVQEPRARELLAKNLGRRETVHGIDLRFADPLGSALIQYANTRDAFHSDKNFLVDYIDRTLNTWIAEPILRGVAEGVTGGFGTELSEQVSRRVGLSGRLKSDINRMSGKIMTSRDGQPIIDIFGRNVRIRGEGALNGFADALGLGSADAMAGKSRVWGEWLLFTDEAVRREGGKGWIPGGIRSQKDFSSEQLTELRVRTGELFLENLGRSRIDPYRVGDEDDIERAQKALSDARARAVREIK